MSMKHYGIYRGVVVGTPDPTNLGRLQVSVPALYGPNYLWAFPCLADPGDSVPEAPIGTGVWVMFEGGDVKYPIYTGFFKAPIPQGTAHTAASSGVHGVAGSVVGTTDSQTLTDKTLVAPTIADFTNAAHDHSTLAEGGILPITSVTGLTDAVTGAWTVYVPALTATTSNPNIGSTGTITGRYRQVGKTVEFQTLVATAGSGVVAGTGEYRLSLPVPPSASTGHCIGYGWLYNTDGFKSIVVDPSPGSSKVRIIGTGGVVYSAWGQLTGAGCWISVCGTYEAS